MLMEKKLQIINILRKNLNFKKIARNSAFDTLKLLGVISIIFSDETIMLFWDKTELVCIKIAFFAILFILVCVLRGAWYCWRSKITIKGDNYNIQVEYGDIFAVSDCKKVIPFDECFTTKVGSKPEEINADSICGQYLKRHPDLDINSICDDMGQKFIKSYSRYNNKPCYKSGTLLVYGDDLLMAFAKLNEDGLAVMSRDDYVDCLQYLWKEIDKYYAQKDVCIPILGSGVTRFGDMALNQQELLDIIILSYKITSYKIKLPYKLRIICQKKDDFSINKISCL